MIEASCYHCDTAKRNKYDEENGFVLWKCVGCGLLYVSPRPKNSEIKESTEEGVFFGKRKLNVLYGFKRKKISKFIGILNEIYSDKNLEGSWLDIGAGYGEFMNALNIYFTNLHTIEGLEPSRVKLKEAKRRGIYIKYNGLNDICIKYNYVSLLNVYSHLSNPVLEINKIKKKLLPGGELLLQTGDVCDLPINQQSKPYFLPNHLSFASEKIVTNILTKLGFEIVNIKKYRAPELPERSIFGLTKQLLKLMHPNKRASFRFFENKNTDMWIRARNKE